MTAAGQRLGTLVLGGRDALDSGQGRTVERAAMVTALVLLFRLRAAEADQRVRTDLLADLLARPATATVDRGLVDRGRLLGLRLQTPHVVAVCRYGAVRPRGLLLTAGQAGAGRGLAGEHRGSVVALVPGTRPVGGGLERWPGASPARTVRGSPWAPRARSCRPAGWARRTPRPGARPTRCSRSG